MKQKILFVMESLRIGGAEKSLVTLLSLLDYSKVDVDLFLFENEGEFLQFVPKEVNIISELENKCIYKHGYIQTIKILIKKIKIYSLIMYLIYLIKLSINHYILKKEYVGWKYIKYLYPKINKQYDVSIGFLEKKSIYFTVDNTISNKKIGYIHNDYEKIFNNKIIDYKYFKELNYIITVSEHCKEVLEKNFTEYKEKIKYIKNFISQQLIIDMSNQKLKVKFNNENINIVTVARLVEQKGIDNAINICEKLVEKYKNIVWYVIGDGSEKERLLNIIKNKKLEKNFILLGSKSNPYKYIKNADIYVQPSRFEGYGITIAEAKILEKNIVATNIPEFAEQLVNYPNAKLARDNEEFVSNISNYITNKEIYSGDSTITKNQIEEFYRILNSKE